MSTSTGGDYDPSTAGPLAECAKCPPSADGRRPVYVDDAAGRRAHLIVIGHNPTPLTEGTS